MSDAAPLNMHEAFWSQRYRDAGEAYLFGTAPNAFLTREGHRLPEGATVLSVADGEGRNSVWLAEHGCRVVATEISPIAVGKAQHLATERNVDVTFVVADVLDWDWPVAAYDAVVAIFIQFAGPEERAILFRNMQAALKPGGLLLLQGYTPEQLVHGTGGPPSLANLYTEDMVRSAFSGMHIEHLRSYEDVLAEGKAHCGRSALIEMVARRR